jgi:tRNA(Ile)-lysidine synthase TilS/MesJ
LDSNKNKIVAKLSPDARYLIGVSGGRNSVALLHWLISLDYKRLIVLPFE